MIGIVTVIRLANCQENTRTGRKTVVIDPIEKNPGFYGALIVVITNNYRTNNLFCVLPNQSN